MFLLLGTYTKAIFESWSIQIVRSIVYIALRTCSTQDCDADDDDNDEEEDLDEGSEVFEPSKYSVW